MKKFQKYDLPEALVEKFVEKCVLKLIPIVLSYQKETFLNGTRLMVYVTTDQDDTTLHEYHSYLIKEKLIP
jgi:hypothetical protein